MVFACISSSYCTCNSMNNETKNRSTLQDDYTDLSHLYSTRGLQMRLFHYDISNVMLFYTSYLEINIHMPTTAQNLLS